MHDVAVMEGQTGPVSVEPRPAPAPRVSEHELAWAMALGLFAGGSAALSAAQSDASRVEPPFQLQGSYRNMNKLTEKIVPVMNDEELESLALRAPNGERGN